jgi:peptide deformylase
MSVHTIVKFGHPILRKVVEPVRAVTPELARLTEDMLETMHEANGVGLAANQIGIDMAIAVIGYREVVLRMFNPKIVERSSGTQVYGEGCLSVPGVDGDVKRALEVTATWLDETGAKQERHFTGHLARIVQHEVDHLNGIVIVNHLSMAAKTLHKKVLERLKDEGVAMAKGGRR